MCEVMVRTGDVPCRSLLSRTKILPCSANLTSMQLPPPLVKLLTNHPSLWLAGVFSLVNSVQFLSMYIYYFPGPPAIQSALEGFVESHGYVSYLVRVGDYAPS